MKLARYHLQSLLAVRPLDRVYAGTCAVGEAANVLIRQLLPGLPTEECLETAAVFERHMQQLTALQEPGTLPVREYVSTEAGPFYYVTDIPNGVTLTELVQSVQGPLRSEMAAAIGVKIGELLAHAHGHGVHHYALQRTSILLSHEPAVSVLDLGLVPFLLERVRVHLREVPTAWEFLFPDAGLVAPEILSGATAGARTDVYGLGGLLYWMMTGELPYSGSSVVVYNSILHGRIAVDPSEKAPQLPVELSALIARCLERAPEQRPASVTEVVDALRPWAGDFADVAASYGRIIRPQSYLERFSPLLRLVDGGRGKAVVEEPAASQGVVPLFSPARPMSEAELLSKMTTEQRGIYLLGVGDARGNSSRGAQLRRGSVYGVMVALLVLFFFMPELWSGTGPQPAERPPRSTTNTAPVAPVSESPPPADASPAGQGRSVSQGSSLPAVVAQPPLRRRSADEESWVPIYRRGLEPGVNVKGQTEL